MYKATGWVEGLVLLVLYLALGLEEQFVKGVAVMCKATWWVEGLEGLLKVVSAVSCIAYGSEG